LILHFAQSKLVSIRGNVVLGQIHFILVLEARAERIKIVRWKSIKSQLVVQFAFAPARRCQSDMARLSKDGPFGGQYGILGNAPRRPLDGFIRQGRVPLNVRIFTGKGTDGMAVQTNVFPNSIRHDRVADQ
jgi:hypothetical protein